VSGERLSVDETIERLIEGGWQDEEIVERFSGKINLFSDQVVGLLNPPERRAFLDAVKRVRARVQPRRGGRPRLEEADIRPRYDDAVAAIRRRSERPTDPAVASELKVGISTLRDWRRAGLIPSK
jgi:hypothetical protein